MLDDKSLDEIYEDIIDTLSKQSDLSEELIVLSDEKISHIRENDSNAILLVTQREERVASEMIGLEKERDFLIKKLERLNSIEITDISHLISQFSGEKGVKLNLIAEKLKANFDRLKQKNDINKSLLEVILDQVEIYNNIIVGEKAPQTYENTKYKKNKYSDSNSISTTFDTKY